MKVSIIIPVYNASKTIKETLSAIIEQNGNLPETEIIAVDDGSTDDTFSILSEFQNIRVLHQENAGPASARNFGAKAAGGDILVFTDSDTVPHSDWLERLVEPFKEPTIVASAGTYSVANYENHLAELIQREIELRHAGYGEFIQFGGTYNLAVRANLFREIGGFDESYRRASGEDNDLCYRILRRGHLIRYVSAARVAHYHPEKLGKYLKEQFRHGYWRAKLYLEHPGRISGDSYTGTREMLETLSSITLICAPFAWLFKYFRAGVFFPRLVFCGISSLIALLALECQVAARLTGNFEQFIFALLVFSCRAIARTFGFCLGMITFGQQRFNQLRRAKFSAKV